MAVGLATALPAWHAGPALPLRRSVSNGVVIVLCPHTRRAEAERGQIAGYPLQALAPARPSGFRREREGEGGRGRGS